MKLKNTNSRQVVLVVEDDPLLRMMAIDFVEEAGFTAISASGADEALNIQQQRNDISVLFTDIDILGRMDGLALANCLREVNAELQIVLTSGHPNYDYYNIPERSVFFEKPYDSDTVTDTIRRLAVPA